MSSAASPLVEARGLVKHFPLRGSGRLAVRSVDGVTLAIGRAEVLGLVGESGCGKSTLARLLINQIRPDRGEVIMDGRDLLAMRPGDLRRFRRTVQLIFQNPVAALDPRMRLIDSLMAPLAAHDAGTREECLEMIHAMLGEVGIDPGIVQRYPGQCSGGQLQRIVIARALLLRPQFVVCDEPTSSLDASIRAQILNLLNDLRRRFDLSLLMISHDLRALRHICDRVAVMYLGRIVEMAPVEQIFQAPRHPYTKALNAASLLDEIGLDAASRLAEGEPPSPVHPPSGCHFHPRCPLADETCRRHVPTLERIAENHEVSCHHWRRSKP